MPEIGIYTDRKTWLTIAKQITDTFGSGEDHTDTTIYAQPNSTVGGEIVLTLSNDDSEPTDGGYQGGGVIVDIDMD